MINQELINDIIYTFEKKKTRQKDNSVIVEEILLEYKDSLEDEDDRNSIYIGIALAQKKQGCLDLLFKSKILEILYSNIQEDTLLKEEKKSCKNIIKFLEKETTFCVHSKTQESERCPWENGDVFAYRFIEMGSGEVRYAYFVKSESVYWDDDSTFPLVYFYNLISKKLIKDINYLNKHNYMVQGYVPSAYINHPELPRMYRLLIEMSKRDYNSKKIIYLGKIDESFLKRDENKNRFFRKFSKLPKYIGKHVKDWSVPCLPV